MKNLPVVVEDEDIDEMFEFADKDGDGKLSYQEFQVILDVVENNKVQNLR
jgi:Ca2+-binding EF-hand superfamily protein